MISVEELKVKNEEEIVDLFRKEMNKVGYEKFFSEISSLYDEIEDKSEEDIKIQKCLEMM